MANAVERGSRLDSPRRVTCAILRRMSDLQWNSVELAPEEQPRVALADLREMAADLDPEDFDEPVQEFLEELERAESGEELARALRGADDEAVAAVDFRHQRIRRRIDHAHDLILFLHSFSSSSKRC